MASELLGLPRGRSLTRADLDDMPDDGHRYELLDGTLIVSPAPRVVHQLVLFNLSHAVRSACPDTYLVLFAPVDVVLADDTVIQPDLIVAAREDFTERDLPGPPLLAVEVLSPSTRGIDLLLKKDRLQRAGCSHYWVVDSEEPSITGWSLQDGAYVQIARAVGDEAFSVTDPFALTVKPVDLVNRPDQTARG